MEKEREALCNLTEDELVMMLDGFILLDWGMILESLQWTKRKFENYPIGPPGGYPSLEFRNNRVEEVTELIDKIRKVRRNK